MSDCSRRCLSTFLFFASLAASAQAQRSTERPRWAGVSGSDSVTVTRDLSDKAQDAWNALQNQRMDASPELHFGVAAFAGTALALSQLAGDNRGDAAIRNGVTRLIALAQEVDPQVSSVRVQPFRDAWAVVQQNLGQLSLSLNISYRAPRRSGVRGIIGAIAGSPGGWFKWQGRVDGSDQIILQGETVSVRHLAFSPIKDASYEMSGPLPSVGATLRLNKLQGRGRVEIVSQPTASNGYACTVLVDDPEGGDDFYRFEVIW